MVGKDPHRHEGKAAADEWKRRASAELPSAKRVADVLPAEKQPPAPAPSRTNAEELRAGARPGVPSRVQEAVERREEREE